MRPSLSFRLVTACLAVILLPTSGSLSWGGDFAAARPARILAVPLGNLNRLQADLPATSLASPTVVLTDTTDMPGANVADSTDWGNHFSTFSSQAADDFVVPGNAFWHITTATAAGSYIGIAGSGVLSLLVQFYTDSGSGLPLSRVLSQTILSANISGLDTGIFVITLTSPLILGPGHYWFSAQARVDCLDSNCKHWVWTERTQTLQTASVWRNPLQGLTPDCPSWQPRVAVCHDPNNSSGNDLLFKLEGSSTPILAQLFAPLVHR